MFRRDSKRSNPVVAGYKGRSGPWLASAGSTFSTKKSVGRSLKKLLMRLSLNMVRAIFLVKPTFREDRVRLGKSGYFANLRPEVSGLRLPF